MQQLHRSRTNRIVAGVLGGLGETYGIDANILRILFAIVALFTGIVPVVVLYFIAWLLIPEKARVQAP